MSDIREDLTVGREQMGEAAVKVRLQPSPLSISSLRKMQAEIEQDASHSQLKNFGSASDTETKRKR